MGIAINNVFDGLAVADPEELQKRLDLDEVGNLMINANYPFEGEAAKSEHAGTKLAVAMMAVKMQKLDAFNVEDFIQRLACRDACDDAPMAMPQGVASLAPTYNRLKEWTAKGWELEVSVSGLSEQDFYEMELFKIQQGVVRDIEAAFAGAKEHAADLLEFPKKKES